MKVKCLVSTGLLSLVSSLAVADNSVINPNFGSSPQAQSTTQQNNNQKNQKSSETQQSSYVVPNTPVAQPTPVAGQNQNTNSSHSQASDSKTQKDSTTQITIVNKADRPIEVSLSPFELDLNNLKATRPKLSQANLSLMQESNEVNLKPHSQSKLPSLSTSFYAYVFPIPQHYPKRQKERMAVLKNLKSMFVRCDKMAANQNYKITVKFNAKTNKPYCIINEVDSDD